MRQQALAWMVIGTIALAGTLSSTVASADSPAPVSAAQTALAQKIIGTAEEYLGAPYSWAGSSPKTGFSCIGLVYYVYTYRNGVPTGQDLEAAYNNAPHVALSDLQPADLVFFSGTVRGMSPLSHVAIYVGNGKMIAADSFQTGVEWDNLNDSYWSAHFAGATRPLAAYFGTAVPASSTPAPDPGAGAPAGPSTQVATQTTTAQVTVTVQEAAPVAATAPKGAALVINQPSVVVRSGPDTTYMSIETVGAGMAMVVIEAQGSWYHVQLNDGQVGWVVASAVGVVPNVGEGNNTASAAAANSGGTAGNDPRLVGRPSEKMAITADVLKVHARPGLTSPMIGQFIYGTVVTVLQVQRDWDLVVGNGTQGWVFSHYLSTDLHLGTNGVAAPAAHPPAPSTQVAGFKQTSSYQVVVVTADALKVHVAPTLQARVVTQVHHGDRLRVLRSGGHWDYIMARGGLRGWVSAQWVHQEAAAVGVPNRA